MFDVIWTDPDRELVGEHRAKKIAREKKRAEEQAEGPRSSLSTRGSSSSNEKPFGFFGSRSLRKAVAPLKSRPSSNSSTLLAHASTPQRPSPLNPQGSPKRNSDASESLSDILRDNEQSPERVPEPRSRNEHISYTSSRDSAISKWTDRTIPSNLSPSATSFDESAKSSVVQPPGQSSFIAQSTEVRPRTPETDILRSISEVSVQSSGGKDGNPSQSQSPETETISDEPDLPINLFPGPKSPLRSLPREWASAFKPNNLDAWKPPAAWNLTPATAGASENAAILPTRDTRQEEARRSRALELRRMKRELEMMAAADPVTILERLRESWGDMTDVILYKELEMEKKRWMLSALYNMDRVVEKATLSPPPQYPGGQPRKVLALHESHATASYLATIHSKEQVYHLSSSPLSYEQFPSIHPVTVPASTSNLPVAARIFSAAYSLSLPSLVSSQDIPCMLKGVHRCLMQGAIFHLTLIDPMPVASSLGPHMRAWLEKHLMLNLEKSFRCVNPSKLFPHWLAESCLRGKGSVISTAKFRAITPEEDRVRETPDGHTDDRSIKAELRGEVGRMLWTEVWGVHVEAERWWWEEPACVQECLQLGTYWEYCLIEAVKEG